MKRLVIFLSVLLTIGAAIFAWLLFKPISPVSAQLGASACQRVALIDQATGAEVSGVEDIAQLPDGTLLLSAHDRLDPLKPDGGVYALDPGVMAEGRAEVASVIDPADTGGSLRPHGIAVTRSGSQLALVNRGRDGINSIDVFALEDDRWAPIDRRVAEQYCRANDLDFSRMMTGRVVVSIDRRSCSLDMGDLLGVIPTGSLEFFVPGDGETPFVMGGRNFPNGIADLWIAETRASRISTPMLRPGGTGVTSIKLPGGPDNISMVNRRTALVAVHPSLLKLGAYRYGWFSKAPSRVVQADLANGSTTVLFDDPTGEVFSGATVAVKADDQLVIGSVIDSGLLVCSGL
ncbi:MAG: hypothetical protein AAGE80_06180 [Pseudomonadota bacterium]